MPTTKSSIKKEIKQLQILLDKQDPLFYQKIDELIKTKRDSVLKSKKIDTLNQLDEQLSKDIDEVLNTCELARFTPLKQQNANDLFHQTNHILQQLNRYV